MGGTAAAPATSPLLPAASGTAATTAGVPAAGGELGVVAVHVDRFLLLEDGGGWFECHAEDNFLAVADAALHAAAAVGGGVHAAGAHLEGVVVLRAAQPRAGESAVAPA